MTRGQTSLTRMTRKPRPDPMVHTAGADAHLPYQAGRYPCSLAMARRTSRTSAQHAAMAVTVTAGTAAGPQAHTAAGTATIMLADTCTVTCRRRAAGSRAGDGEGRGRPPGTQRKNRRRRATAHSRGSLDLVP